MAADAGDDGGGISRIGSLGDVTPGVLRETFPKWRIFHGDGAWWAVRGGPYSWSGPESLLLRAMTSADLTGLAERLCLQEWLDGLDPEALATVYQGTMLRSAT